MALRRISFVRRLVWAGSICSMPLTIATSILLARRLWAVRFRYGRDLHAGSAGGSGAGAIGY